MSEGELAELYVNWKKTGEQASVGIKDIKGKARWSETKSDVRRVTAEGYKKIPCTQPRKVSLFLFPSVPVCVCVLPLLGVS